MSTARQELPAAWFESGQLTLAKDQYDAAIDADAIVLVTEWKLFRYPDWSEMKKRMRGQLVLDGRNQYDPVLVRQQGFTYVGIGR
jgi:UDPglucose 6-dehydrogenase